MNKKPVEQENKWQKLAENNNNTAENETQEDKEVKALEHPAYLELEEKLNEAETALDVYKNQALRTQAEMENLRRRVEKDISNAHKYALEKFVNELLSVVDSLERGLAIAVSDNEFASKIHEGVEMTYSLFIKTLEKFGVKQINPLGDTFNPEFHQAISMQEDPEAKPNTVLQVLQKGYLLNERLIRPALVVVAKS